jgi:hypothetical protein
MTKFKIFKEKIFILWELHSKILVGDEINVLMAACAWNLSLFWQKVGLCMVRSLYFFYYTQ